MRILKYCILFVLTIQPNGEIDASNLSNVNSKGHVEHQHKFTQELEPGESDSFSLSPHRERRSDGVYNDYVTVLKMLCRTTKNHRERVGMAELVARDDYDGLLMLATESNRTQCFLKRHWKCIKRLFTSRQENQLKGLRDQCMLNTGGNNPGGVSGDFILFKQLELFCYPFEHEFIKTTSGADRTVPTEAIHYITTIERNSGCTIEFIESFYSTWANLYEQHRVGRIYKYKFRFRETFQCRSNRVCRVKFQVQVGYCPDLNFPNVTVSDPIPDGTTDYHVQLSCEHSGYDLQPASSDTIRCRNYENWEEYDRSTTCIAKLCTEQPEISQTHALGSCELRNGNEVITSEPPNVFRGSVCWFSCVEGTFADESPGNNMTLTLTCADDLTWNYQQLRPCEANVVDPEISCPTVVAVAGQTTSWADPVASGYGGRSVTVARDTDNNHASGDVFELDCGNPLYCVESISYTATDSDGNFATCDVVVNVTRAHCDEIVIDNGYTTCDSTAVGTVCSFGCHGFTFFVGSETATCAFDTVTDSAGWLYSNGLNPPTCEAYPCANATLMLANGAVSCTVRRFTSCTATCDSTFSLPFEIIDTENPANGHACTNRPWDIRVIPQCTEPLYARGVRFVSTAGYNVPGPCPMDQMLLEDVETQYWNGIESYINSDEGDEGDDLYDDLDSLAIREMRVCDDSDEYDIVLSISHTLLHPTSDDTWSPAEIADIQFLRHLDNAYQRGYFTLFGGTLEDVDYARTIECEDGYAPALGNVNLCVPCSLGSVYDNGECLKCSQGFYQAQYGQSECFACPGGQSTKYEGSVDASSCVEICVTGTYSTTGLQPCIPCPANTYQDDVGQNECISCPADTVTARPAATSYTDCFSPVGNCTGVDCNGNGRCHSLGSLTLCLCDSGFYGDRCESGTHPCMDHMCDNSATCSAIGGTYVCECSEGFTGHYCNGIITDGEWGAWNGWTICPNCTDGESFEAEQSRLRTCSNPAPQNGGDDCVGDSVETRACVLSPCGECPEFPTRENSIIECTPSQGNYGDHNCVVVCDAGYELGPGETIIKCGPNTSYELRTIDDETITPDQLSTRLASCAGSAPLIEYSQTLEVVFPAEDDEGCNAQPSCGGIVCECTNPNREKREASENFYTIILRFNVTSAVEHFFIDGVFDNATAVAAQDEMFNQSVAIANELAIIRERIENGTYSIIIGEHEYFPNPDSFQVIESQRCPTGMLMDGLLCRNCSVGSYQEDRYDSCLSCPLGQYQGLEGQTSCHACPDSMTTNTIGSMFIEHCVPLNPESCPAGSYLDETECIRCLVGNYQDNVNETSCIPCDVGTYQAEIGQDACRVCPDGQTTDHIGSTSLDNCWINPDVCGQGTYHYGGTCEDCPYGYYQNRVGQSYCEPCNIFATTNTRGSTSSQDCVLAYETYDEICSPGTYNSSYGCENCSVGTYQPYRGQPSCYECPSGTTTNHIGSTDLSRCVDDDSDNSKKSTRQDIDAVSVTIWAIIGAVVVLVVVIVVVAVVVGIKFHNRHPKTKPEPQPKIEREVSGISAVNVRVANE